MVTIQNQIEIQSKEKTSQLTKSYTTLISSLAKTSPKFLSEIQGRQLEHIGTKFGDKVFARFTSILTANYKIDYTDKNKMNYENAKLIYNMALEKQMTAEEFGVILKKFINENQYPNFTAANFFKIERLKLYPKSWKNAEMSKDSNNIANMECFVYNNNGKEIEYYRYYDIDNPVITHPDFKIKSARWDIGGKYKHQYQFSNSENLTAECSNCKILELRIKDLIELNNNLQIQLRGMSNEK